MVTTGELSITARFEGGYFFVISSLMVLISREVVLKWLGIQNANMIALIANLRWIVIFLLFFSCISFIYKLAPSVHKKWKLINPGSILATGLMLITSERGSSRSESLSFLNFCCFSANSDNDCLIEASCSPILGLSPNESLSTKIFGQDSLCNFAEC